LILWQEEQQASRRKPGVKRLKPKNENLTHGEIGPAEMPESSDYSEKTHAQDGKKAFISNSSKCSMLLFVVM
jgi:hypothetical protein